MSTSRERFRVEREAGASFSPTLFSDFATVFVYGSSEAESADGYLEEAGHRAEPN
jgi:hypothetical protein